MNPVALVMVSGAQQIDMCMNKYEIYLLVSIKMAYYSIW